MVTDLAKLDRELVEQLSERVGALSTDPVQEALDIIVTFKNMDQYQGVIKQVSGVTAQSTEEPIEYQSFAVSNMDILEALDFTQQDKRRAIEDFSKATLFQSSTDIESFDDAMTNSTTEVRPLKLVQSMNITMPPALVLALTEKENIAKVEPVRPVFESVSDSVAQIGVNPSLWQYPFQLSGKGIKVGILDTGIDLNHPDIVDKIIPAMDQPKQFRNFTSPNPDDAYNIELDTGHGTHVTGACTGTGKASMLKYRGVAYDAETYVGKVLTLTNGRGTGKNSWVIQGIQWLLDIGIDIISMSLGGSSPPSDGNDALSRAVNNAVKDFEVPVLVAAGNAGAYGVGQMGSPAMAINAITVGASDPNDNITPFSTWAHPDPAPTTGPKPDVVNLGADIVAAKQTNKDFKPFRYTNKRLESSELEQYYTPLSGTSMATPITTGVVALMLEAYYNQNGRMNLAERKRQNLTGKIKQALMDTAIPLKDKNGNQYPYILQGKGRVRALEALQKLLELAAQAAPQTEEAPQQELTAELPVAGEGRLIFEGNEYRLIPIVQRKISQISP